MKHIISYWLTVVRRASGASLHLSVPLLGDVAKAFSTVAVVALLGGVFGGKALEHIGVGPDAAASATEAARVIVAVFVCGWVVSFLAALIATPANMARDLQRELDTREERLRPHLTVTAPEKTAAICGGATSVSLSGFVQTVLSSHEDTIRLHCKNTSAVGLDACEGRIISASRLVGGAFRDLRMVEDIQLVWDRDLKKSLFSVRLDPQQTKCLYIGTVRQAGNVIIWRNLNELPTEYVHLFTDPGTYHLGILIKSINAAASVMTLEIETAAAVPEPNKRPVGDVKFRLIDPIQEGEIAR